PSVVDPVMSAKRMVTSLRSAWSIPTIEAYTGTLLRIEDQLRAISRYVRAAPIILRLPAPSSADGQTVRWQLPNDRTLENLPRPRGAARGTGPGLGQCRLPARRLPAQLGCRNLLLLRQIPV